MNPIVGWALAAAAVVVGALGWGWRGVVLAVTVTAFWLLLQFSRALRLMRAAARRPLGEVPSALMLHAKLQPGLTMLQVVRLAGALGARVSAEGAQPEVWRWHDAGGAAAELTFTGARLASFALRRPADPADATPPAP